MKITVTLSVLPHRREIFQLEAQSTAAAISEVLQRNMVTEALGRLPSASVIVSAMPSKKEKGEGQ